MCLQAQQLRLKIQEQDVYDLQAFKQLLDDVRGAAMSDEIRLVYEELVAAFPTAVSGSCSATAAASGWAVATARKRRQQQG